MKTTYVLYEISTRRYVSHYTLITVFFEAFKPYEWKTIDDVCRAKRRCRAACPGLFRYQIRKRTYIDSKTSSMPICKEEHIRV